MSTTQSPDDSPITIVRRELQQIRSKARETGVLRSKSVDAPSSGSGKPALSSPDTETEGSENKGKEAASKLQTLLRRGENDTSPNIPGTDFTEEGVARLLNLLTTPRERDGASQKMLQRIHLFLTGTIAEGAEMVAGVSVHKVRLLARILKQIEKHGWEHVRAHLAKRKAAAAAAKPRTGMEPKPDDAPATPGPRPKNRARSKA